MAISKSKSTIVASTSNAAGAATRGTLDVTAKYGGIITMRLDNGATGPTAPCICTVMISHEDTLPAAGALGADWKKVYQFSGTTGNSEVVHQTYTFGPEVRHIQVAFTSNTGQAVTVEAIASTFTV